MSRYYDPMGRSYVNMFNTEYKNTLGLDVPFENLPHMCLRFVGLKDEVDRRLLSYKITEKNSPVFPVIEAGEDIDQSKIDEFHSMVSITVGHFATDDEVVQYLKSRGGSRAMSGVRGDLLSMETWLKHSHTVLQDRGMVSGADDVVMGLVADEPYQLRTRVTERASVEINKLVEKHPRMLEAEANSAGDENLSADALETEKEKRRHRIRTELYQTLILPDYLDDLRHCGPLRITVDNIKRTYHNKTANKDSSGKEKQAKKPSSYTGASSYSDTKTSMKQALFKSKRQRPELVQQEGVFSRGERDSRRRSI
tara:strand:- start:58 stop:987 length:930 start_codon:yes stop_codon:yes gene_type:complete